MKEHFSGWRVLAGCVMCMFLVQGTIQAFAVFLPAIVADTGWRLSLVAQVSTFCSGSAFLANLALSPALKKISARGALAIGAVFLVLEDLIFCVSRSVYAIWFGAFLGGMALAWGTVAPCTIILTNWFNKNRSQFVAAAVAGSMLGSVVLNPVCALLIDALGWRRAYLITGPGAGLCALLLIFLLIRDDPAALGQRPYGEEETVLQAQGGVDAVTARRSLSYGLLILGTFLLGFATNVENYMPAFWQSRGLSPVLSSLVLSAYAFVAAVLSLGFSRVNDRLGGGSYVLLTSLCFAGSLLLMCYTGVCGSLPLLLLCCVPLAAGAKKAVTLTPPLVVAEAFGRRDYARIIGPFAAVLQLGVASSNLVIGPLADRSYALAFTAMTAVNLLGALAVILALKKKPYRGDAAVSASQAACGAGEE
ncbi:MAG: MFS transporter [Candidatus Limivicinus sp.]